MTKKFRLLKARYIITKYCCSILFFCLLISAEGFAQYNNPDRFTLKDVTPRSPNAASFEKYLNVPVNLNSGQLGLTIPLYTIQHGDVAIPIQLTYNNTGLKLTEIPSWVGLGWDLNVGGAIMQQVKGIPDDATYGIMNGVNERNINSFEGLPNWKKGNFLLDVQARKADFQRDVFSYSFLGRGGSFYIDSAKKCVSIIKDNLKIAFQRIGGTGNIISFTILDENGFEYKFDIREESNSDAGGVELTENAGATWYLSKITSPAGRVVEFKYKYSQILYAEPYESISFAWGFNNGRCLPYFANSGRNKTIQTNYLLTEIVFDGGKTVFTSQTSRNDVKTITSYTGANVNDLPALDKIEVWDTKLNKVIKAFNFSYKNNSTRLFLKSLAELSCTSCPEKKEHIFNYYAEDASFPNLDRSGDGFKQQDHWGYYNGAPNQTLIPKFNYKDYTFPEDDIERGGANRRANGEYAITGMLKSIKYPTGGETLFEYEGNKLTFPNLTSVPPILYEPPPPTNQVTLAYFTSTTTQVKNFTVTQKSDLSFTEVWVYPKNGVTEEPAVSISNIYAVEKSSYSFEMQPGIMYLEKTYKAKNVAPGQYTISMEIYNAGQSVEMTVQAAESINPALPVDVEFGGVRIKKVTYKTGNDIAKVSSYRYQKGYYRNLPTYMTFTSYLVVTGSIPEVENGCLTSNTMGSSWYNKPLTYHMEYIDVDEVNQENGVGGMIKYHFSLRERMEIEDLHYFYLDQTHSQSGGDLISKEYHQKLNNDTYRCLKRENYSYYFNEILDQSNPNYLYAFPNTWTINDHQAHFPRGELYTSQDDAAAAIVLNASHIFKYFIYSFRKHLQSESVTDYVYNGNAATPIDSIVSGKSYYYDGTNPELLARVESSNSKKQLQIIKNKYPQDLSFTDPLEESARLKLIERNMVSPILQQETLLNTTLLNQKKIHYKIFSPNQPQPATIEVKNGGNNAETLFQFYNYDKYGNILEQSKTGDAREIYLWGYNSMYPVAKVLGSTYSAVSALVSQTLLDQPLNEQQLKDELKKIRIGLAGTAAQVFTYTYISMVGISSETDAAGRTSYYEYDSFNRLKLIKDQDGKILKQFDYQYQAPLQQ